MVDLQSLQKCVDALMPKPDFFIVGAPKCGTTALYTYLSRHPDVGMSRAKEPNYFAPDTVAHRSFSTLEDYLTNFESAAGKLRVGEASVMYLSSPAAPLAIREFKSSAQIIIMVRDPVEVLHALHSQNLHGGSEHVLEFADALASDEPRYWLQGPFCGEAVGGPSYRELVCFSAQIERYLEIFGEECVHLIDYEDFACDPKGAYERVLSFLGLDSDERNDFPVVNANRRVRYLTPHRWMRHPALLRLKREFPSLARGARSAMDFLNVVEEGRPTIAPDLRRRLDLEFAEERQKVNALLERRLQRRKTRMRLDTVDASKKWCARPR